MYKHKKFVVIGNVDNLDVDLRGYLIFLLMRWKLSYVINHNKKTSAKCKFRSTLDHVS